MDGQKLGFLLAWKERSDETPVVLVTLPTPDCWLELSCVGINLTDCLLIF